MKHSLGSLQIDREAMLTSLLQRVHGPEALGRFLRDLSMTRHPDLLAVLDADDRDRPWVEAVLATVEELRTEGHALALADCERTTDGGGQCAVMLYNRALARSIRKGDVVTAGVAVLSSPDTGLVVMPRVFRKVCSNGAVVDQGSTEVREVLAWQVGEAMRACLAPSGFEMTVERFTRAASMEVDDLDALLDRAQPVTGTAALLARWRQAGDSTVFGLVNAATALAHGEMVPSRRLDRERDAERLLAAVESMGPPARRWSNELAHCTTVG